MIILRCTKDGYLLRLHSQIPPVFIGDRNTAISVVERLWRKPVWNR